MAKWGFLKNIVNIDRFFASGAGSDDKKDDKKEEKKEDKKDDDAKLAQHVEKIEAKEEASEQEEKTSALETAKKPEETSKPVELPAPVQESAPEKPAEQDKTPKDTLEKKPDANEAQAALAHAAAETDDSIKQAEEDIRKDEEEK